MASPSAKLQSLLQFAQLTRADFGTDLLSTVAGLLVLRWAESEDAERAAMAAFNGEDYAPILSKPLDWLRLREELPQDPAMDLWPRIYAALGLPTPPLGVPAPTTALDAWRSANLVDWARSLSLDRPADRRTAEQALADVAAPLLRRDWGQFATPVALARLMVALAAPQPGERIYDPCFGTGTLLSVAADALWTAGRSLSPGAWARAIEQPLSGVEINHSLHLMAFVRLLLLGFRPALVQDDALMRAPDAGFDVVLANPPWGGQTAHMDLHGLPVRSRTLEGLFLQHALRALRPGGRAVLALPRGFLWREGGDARTREWAQDHGFSLDAVLQVPSETERSAVPVSLVVLRSGTARDPIPVLTLDRLPAFAEEAEALAASLRAHPSATDAGDLHLVSLQDMRARDHRWGVPPEQSAEGADRVAALGGLVPLVPLAEMATIIGGKTPAADQTSAVPVPGASPLVRVGDLVQERIELGARYVVTIDEPEIHLHPSDLLLSIRGTVGKVALGQRVTWAPGRALPGALADTLELPLPGTGLAILRPGKDVSAEYLNAILRSAAFQALLHAQARGVGVQGISLSDLRRMQIPLPSREVQQRLVRRLRERPGDAVGALLAILRGEEEHPVVRVLNDSDTVAQLLSDHPLRVEEQQKLVYESLDALRRAVSEGRDAELPPDVAAWLETIRFAPLHLLDFDEAREAGVEPVAALQMFAGFVQIAMARLEDGVLAQRAKRLSAAWIAWAASARVAAASDFVFFIEDDPETGDGAGGGVSRVSVWLRGSASLRDVQFTVVPGGPTALMEVFYPDHVEVLRVVVNDEVPSEEHDDMAWHERILHWTATRADGVEVQGEIPFTVSFSMAPPLEEETESEPTDLGGSPYNVGGVVSNPELFFGREDVIARILTQLRGATRVILLEGNRRMGKTSLLHQIQQPKYGLVETWMPVYVSFQGVTGDARRDGVPTAQIFSLIVAEIAVACFSVGLTLPVPGMSPVTELEDFAFELELALPAWFAPLDPYRALQLYLDRARRMLAPRRILLILDEFDKVQVGIESGVTSPMVPENLRNLTQTRPDLGLLLSGSRRLKHLRESYWSALFGIGYRVGLDPLGREEARALVTRPVEGRLTFRPEAVDRILDQSACHPYVVQMLCGRIFELAREHRSRRVDVALVDEAIARTVTDNEHFATLWDASGTARRQYLLCRIQELEGGPDRVGVDLLWALAEGANLAETNEEIARDIEALRELELVRMKETPAGAAYSLEIPMMGAWIVRHQDIADVKRRARAERA